VLRSETKPESQRRRNNRAIQGVSDELSAIGSKRAGLEHQPSI
jgi:hypothetical protein